MILATAFDDREQFDHLWQWTQRELQVRRDALFSWKWEPGAGKVTDSNSASDGDILIAWGLLRADQRWQAPAYRTAAARSPRLGARQIDRAVALWLNAAARPGRFPARCHPCCQSELLGVSGLRRFRRVRIPTPSGRTEAQRDRIAPRRPFRQVAPANRLDRTGRPIQPANGFPPEFGFNAMRIRSMCCGPISALMIPRWKAICWRRGRQSGPLRALRGPIPATLNMVNGARSDYGLSAGGRAIAALTLNGEKAAGSLGAGAAPNERMTITRRPWFCSARLP